MEYVAMTSPIVFMVLKRTGRPITTLGLLRYSKLVAATKGWAISPVHKSVSTSALRRMWKGVLRNAFFQIAAKISEFPTTATGDIIAIMTEFGKIVICTDE